MAKYTQIKVSIKPEIAESYKLACKKAGIKMAQYLGMHMRKQSGLLLQVAQREVASTRQRRRKRLSELIPEIESILAKEIEHRDNIPENLQSGAPFEAAEDTISALEDALDRLVDAFI